MGSTKRASVLDARSAPHRGEDRLKAIRINPTLAALGLPLQPRGLAVYLCDNFCGDPDALGE